MNARRLALTRMDAMGSTRCTGTPPAVYPTRWLELTRTGALPELRDVVPDPSDEGPGRVLNEVHRHLHDTVRAARGGGSCPECRSARVLLAAFVAMTAAVLLAVWEWIQHDTLNLLVRL